MENIDFKLIPVPEIDKKLSEIYVAYQRDCLQKMFRAFLKMMGKNLPPSDYEKCNEVHLM